MLRCYFIRAGNLSTLSRMASAHYIANISGVCLGGHQQPVQAGRESRSKHTAAHLPKAAAVPLRNHQAVVTTHAAAPFFNGGAGLQALQAAQIGALRQSRSISSAVPCRAAVAEAEAPVEKFEYQAEVSRLLDLIVNSLYSHKEVFLRELVSNASDALDKLRFLSVTDQSLLAAGEELVIRIKADKEAGTITITDTGIGMTKEELVDSLGTIAQSGTAKFVKALQEKKEPDATTDNNLIGQFGVGFYSSFLVAEKVTVTTRSARGGKQYVWEAAADSSSYTITEETDESKALPRGTSITLHLKGDAKYEYGEPSRIEGLVKNYSQFISFPIYTWKELSRSVEVEEDDPDVKEGEEPKKKTKTVQEKYHDWELANETKPIWMRTPKDVTKEDYDSFLKTTFKEFVDPQAYSHFTTEGEIEFRSLLYVPGMAPYDADQFFNSKTKNIRLYVKRVFISDEFDGELFPRYLGFIKGVVDSNDLPLNVSREILQESRIVRIMKKRLVRKTFDMLDEIAGREEKEDYKTFWQNFGKYLKIGCIDDSANHSRLTPLLRFHSNKSETELTSLPDYVERMKAGQTSIYYFAADSLKSASSAPFLEKLAKKDYEVLFLVEPVDEVAVQNLQSFKEHKFIDISKEDLDLGDEDEKEKDKELEKEYASLCDWMKGILGEKVAKVAVSKRIERSPCVLVAGKFGWSANMERIMRAQQGTDASQMEFMRGRRVLEVNPDHPIVRDLNDQCKDSPHDPKAKQMVELLYETAHLTSGFPPENPSEFGSRVYEMMAFALARGQEEKENSADMPMAKDLQSPDVVEASEVRPESDPWGNK